MSITRDQVQPQQIIKQQNVKDQQQKQIQQQSVINKKENILDSQQKQFLQQNTIIKQEKAQNIQQNKILQENKIISQERVQEKGENNIFQENKLMNNEQVQNIEQEQIIQGKTYDQIQISKDFQINQNVYDHDSIQKEQIQNKQKSQQIYNNLKPQQIQDKEKSQQIYMFKSQNIQNPQTINKNFSYFQNPSKGLNSQTTKFSKKSIVLPPINISSKVKLKPNYHYQQPLSEKLFKNKHLRYLFTTFCKQMYTNGARWTFDDVARNSEIMSVSKWMVFCKQFSLTKKLSQKQAIDIFRQATNFHSQMTYVSFVRGIQIAKSKASIEQKQLIQDILHVSNHLDAREKLRNLKIHFNGPSVNYLEECRYTQIQKIAVRPKKQYKRQIILHQGRSQQDLQRQLKQRKEIRQKKKKQKNAVMHNYLSNYSQVNTKGYTSLQRPNVIKKRQRYFQSYKTIFKNTINKDKLNTQRTIQSVSGINASKTLDCNKIKDKKDSQVHSKSIQKSRRDFLTDDSGYQSSNKQQLKQIDINDKKMIQQVNQWIVDSDAQSDEILKQHYTHEKNARKLANINIKLGDNKKTEKIQTLQDNDNDEQTQLMITQYH